MSEGTRQVEKRLLSLLDVGIPPGETMGGPSILSLEERMTEAKKILQSKGVYVIEEYDNYGEKVVIMKYGYKRSRVTLDTRKDSLLAYSGNDRLYHHDSKHPDGIMMYLVKQFTEFGEPYIHVMEYDDALEWLFNSECMTDRGKMLADSIEELE